jgi:hypothetical protein
MSETKRDYAANYRKPPLHTRANTTRPRGARFTVRRDARRVILASQRPRNQV